MNKFDQYTESLLEEVVYKKKFGGAESAGNKAEIIGKKFVDTISLLRELNIEIVHFDNLIEGASKVKPMDTKVLTELQKAKKSMSNAYNALEKTVDHFPIVMPNAKIDRKK